MGGLGFKIQGGLFAQATHCHMICHCFGRSCMQESILLVLNSCRFNHLSVPVHQYNLTQLVPFKDSKGKTVVLPTSVLNPVILGWKEKVYLCSSSLLSHLCCTWLA